MSKNCSYIRIYKLPILNCDLLYCTTGYTHFWLLTVARSRQWQAAAGLFRPRLSLLAQPPLALCLRLPLGAGMAQFRRSLGLTLSIRWHRAANRGPLCTLRLVP